MSKVCEITGKTIQVGCNVSHSNRRTKKRFYPNLQSLSFHSEALGQAIRLRVSTQAMRTIEHNGGLDSFVAKTAKTKLPKSLHPLKKKLTEQAAA